MAGQVELPGRIVLLQGRNWTIFQKLAGRGRSRKGISEARILEDGSEEYGPVRKASGDDACVFCCSSVTKLTENRPGSKSLSRGQARGDEVKAFKMLLLSSV